MRFQHQAEARGRTIPRGFTLLETLVVVAVIGMVVALLLPALQAAREASRRLQCVGNLKQLGLALHDYASTHGVFPGGQGGRGQSLHVALLPHVEQSALYNSINLVVRIDDEPWNRTILGARVDVYLCPSDPLAWRMVRSSSYAGNTGDGWYSQGFNGLFAPDDSAPSNVAPRDVADGLSGTAAMSEWLIGTMLDADPRRHFFRPKTLAAPYDGGQFAQACASAGSRPTEAHIRNLKASAWQVGEWSRSLYDHALPINGVNCISPDFARFLGSCPAGSQHAAGANVLLGDGAVRFAKASIDLQVWQALGTRNAGEIVSSEAF